MNNIKWISIKQELPEKAGKYLVTYIEPWFHQRMVGIMEYHVGGNLWIQNKMISDYVVTHWAFLPSLPEDE